jgi:hypothetical protein
MLTCFAWVFFRAGSLQEAMTILNKIFAMKGPLFIGSPAFAVYSVFGIIFLFLVEFKAEYLKEKLSLFHHSNGWVRKFSYTFILLIILMFGVFDGGQFIYFQF